jgi:hypothetical protein
MKSRSGIRTAYDLPVIIGDFCDSECCNPGGIDRRQCGHPFQASSLQSRDIREQCKA